MKSDSRINKRAESPELLRMFCLTKSTLWSGLSIKCRHTSDLSELDLSDLKEHSSSDKSEVCRHLMDNPDHKVDFAKPNILSSSGDSARLLILESLFIQKFEPLLNVDSKSAPLYLFNC